MTRNEIELQVRQALVDVAPELASVTLDSGKPLRDQVDLDSMDFLRYVMALHKRCGVDVPEADSEKVSTVASAVDYIAARVGASRL